MASYKVIVKSKPNRQFSLSPGDVTVYDGEGNFVEGIQHLEFVASIESFPTLKLTTLVKDFELEIPEESVLFSSLKKECLEDADEISEFLKKNNSSMNQEQILKKLKINA